MSGSTRFHSELIALPPWAGRVVSAWSRASLARSDSDGSFVTLLHGDALLVPWGIALPGHPAMGAEVSLQGRLLRVGGETRQLEGPGLDLGIPRLDLPDRGILERQAAETPLPPISCLCGSDAALERRLTSGLSRLVEAVLGERDGIAAALGDLVGLGVGSTPSGDDMIVGFTAMARRLDALLPAGTLAALDQALDEIPAEITTPMARAMLGHATRGSFPQALADLARAIGDPDILLSRAVTSLTSVGARSGTDMLVGGLALVQALVRTRS